MQKEGYGGRISGSGSQQVKAPYPQKGRADSKVTNNPKRDR